MLDVFFLSYNEIDAHTNFENLKLVCPNAKRVNGVKGILKAHQQCAANSNTSHFYVVDADAIIDKHFDFKFIPRDDKFEYVTTPETNCVFVWQSINPINDLIYGYGAVKLFPRNKLLNAKNWNIDMTTTIGATFVSKSQISNITSFNTDPFNTWKSAFRECVKLSSAVIPNGNNADNEVRLKTWTEQGKNRKYGNYCLLGAIQGKDYGTIHKENPTMLNNINDFDWLQSQFDTYERNVNA